MTATPDEFSGRKRTAWMIVLLAFAVFLLIATSIPLFVSSWLRRSVRPMTSVAVSNQGTLALVQSSGETSAILATENGEFLSSGDSLITREADNGTLVITHPDSEELILRGQLYANTDVQLNAATTPRFGVSNFPDYIKLDLNEGRLRLTIPEEKKPISYEVTLPQGSVVLSGPGQYALHVSAAESQISVFEGYATLTAATGTGLEMIASQRGVLEAGDDPAGPFATAQNLVKNGSFDQGLDEWIAQDWLIELADQPMGEIKIETFTGDNSLRIIRNGIGHAETAVRQIINQDVTDFELLELVVTLKIHGQTLWVCGTVGSECPLTVRIEYEDDLGIVRTWEQGFFADGEVSATSPDECQTCVLPINKHERVQPGRILVQEIDIIHNLSLQGLSQPSQLRSITILAAGHAFDSEVFDISLNARE